nr:reverse transcriptase domain-containing protein [Tanacetum cinerariifolium]
MLILFSMLKVRVTIFFIFFNFNTSYGLILILRHIKKDVRIGERQRDEDEPKLLETIVGRVVPLLLVAPDRSSGELEASLEKLFGEGGSGEQAKQGDSASGGHGVGIDVVAETSVEDVAPAQLKRQKKRKIKVADAGEPSHPAKKLRDEYGAPGGPTVGGKSQSSIQRLLAGAVQNAEVKGGVIPTLPFVSSSVSTTPKREGGDHTKLLARANLRAIGAPQRTSMPIITIATTTTPTVDPASIAKEKFVGSSVFCADSPSTGGSHLIPGGFSDCSGSDFLIGGIRTVIDPDSNLQKVYVPQWNVTNGFCLDDSGVCREMVDEFTPPKFFAYVPGMDHDQLFTEFNVGATHQISFSAEVRMHAEYNIKEKRRLNSVETEAAETVHLRAEASKFEIVEKSLRDETQVLKERNATLEKEKSELEIQVTDLAALVKVREQEVTDLDVVVTSVKLQNDSLADQVHKLEASSVGLQEKLTVYENRMSQLERFQDEKMEEDGLSGGITHGAEGRKLTDVAAYNPSAKADYLSALQCLQSVNFSLIAKLKANKDASVETIMNLLRLKDALAESLGLVESQPHVDQLMVLVHRSPDQCVIGPSALSLSLDVSSSRVQKIKENIANHVSALRGVFVPLFEPLSAMALEGTEDGQEGMGAGGETVADESVGCRLSKRRNSLRTLNITSRTIPTFFEYVRIKSFEGPFPSSRGNMYILVGDDYLSKCVEAKALPTNDARVAVKFLKSLFSRFGTPRAIISDRGTHFCNDKFAKIDPNVRNSLYVTTCKDIDVICAFTLWVSEEFVVDDFRLNDDLESDLSL